MSDTIAAISTALGEGGIGIVRMSGKKSLEIADKIFKGRKISSLKDVEQRKLTYGHIVNPKDGKIIDEVLIVYMKAPHTYTREDIIEINCHGGVTAVRKILEIVLQNGARLAERGEFTKRAFLNGRLDLSQAEAVIDLIRAKTDVSYDVALGQLEGNIFFKVKDLIKLLMDMLAHIEVSIDFPEEDVEKITYSELDQKANKVLNEIKNLLSTTDRGKILREGLNTAILGKPNVGKSSLLNAILKENRAIVTDIPGTTRDVIEEYVNIDGIPLKIVDTAGIRETEDLVEKIGVDKAKEVVEISDLVIVVFDVSRKLTQEDIKIIDIIKDKKAILVFNKTDLPNKFGQKDIKDLISGKKIINASIKQNKGIKEIEDTIKDMFYSGKVESSNEIIVTNVRHKNQLLNAEKNIFDALQGIKIGMPLDCIEVDIKNCWQNLGEISGDTVSEDIINKIFSEFCIGK